MADSGKTTGKPSGTSMIFVNARQEILLLLRDDNPDIKFPNMWDIPGGHVEENENPDECIKREIAEEFGISISDFHLFEEKEFPDRFEYTFWMKADLDIENIQLTEGQRLAWFTKEQAASIEIAFGFNSTISSFFSKAPYLAKR